MFVWESIACCCQAATEPPKAASPVQETEANGIGQNLMGLHRFVVLNFMISLAVSLFTWLTDTTFLMFSLFLCGGFVLKRHLIEHGHPVHVCPCPTGCMSSFFGIKSDLLIVFLVWQSNYKQGLFCLTLFFFGITIHYMRSLSGTMLAESVLELHRISQFFIQYPFSSVTNISKTIQNTWSKLESAGVNCHNQLMESKRSCSAATCSLNSTLFDLFNRATIFGSIGGCHYIVLLYIHQEMFDLTSICVFLLRDCMIYAGSPLPSLWCGAYGGRWHDNGWY